MPSGFGSGFGRDFGDLAGGHLGKAGEHVAQVGQRIEVTAAAALDDGLEDGSALAGGGSSDEQPVLLADGGVADGVLDPAVVDLDAAQHHIASPVRGQWTQGVLYVGSRRD